MKSLIDRKNHIRDGYTPVKIVATVIFLIYSVSLLVIPLWAFLMSLKSRFEYITDMVSLPKEWMFSNYITAFTELSTGGNNMFVMLSIPCGIRSGTAFAPLPLLRSRHTLSLNISSYWAKWYIGCASP